MFDTESSCLQGSTWVWTLWCWSIFPSWSCCLVSTLVDSEWSSPHHHVLLWFLVSPGKLVPVILVSEVRLSAWSHLTQGWWSEMVLVTSVSPSVSELVSPPVTGSVSPPVSESVSPPVTGSVCPSVSESVSPPVAGSVCPPVAGSVVSLFDLALN